jgi:VanZ family protein
MPLVVLHLYRPKVSNFWLETFYEWLHVPVFVIVAIGLFHALGNWRTNVNKAILAFVAALVLAVLSEAAQIPTSRNASWSDIISDATGAAIGLLAIPTVTDRARLKVISRVIAIILVVITAVPLIQVSAAYVERNSVFPIIYDGDWPTRSEFMTLRGMAIDFRNLYPDWRNYSTLSIDLDVLSDLPFQLTVRVHDKDHLRGSQPYSDRFNKRFDLEPGRNAIEIPLGEIESSPRKRVMDLSRVDGLVLFSNQDEEEHTVRLNRVWLN